MGGLAQKFARKNNLVSRTSERVSASADPGHEVVLKKAKNRGPGSAAPHFVLRRARDTRLIRSMLPQIPFVPAKAATGSS